MKLTRRSFLGGVAGTVVATRVVKAPTVPTGTIEPRYIDVSYFGGGNEYIVQAEEMVAVGHFVEGGPTGLVRRARLGISGSRAIGIVTGVTCDVINNKIWARIRLT